MISKDMVNILWGIDYEPLLDPLDSPFYDSWKFEQELKEKKKYLLFQSKDDQMNFFSWKSQKDDNIRSQYEKAIANLEKKQEYYYGCSLHVYEQTYTERLQKFLDSFPESEEEDFIEYELEKGISKLPYNTDYFFQDQLKRFRFSLKKRFAFLKDHADRLEYNIPKKLLVEYWEPEIVLDQIKEPDPIKDNESNKLTSLTSELPVTEKATAAQWMLFYYILQEAKLKPRFIYKTKELKDLAVEYDIYWKNLQLRYNLISTSQGREGFTQTDTIVVERMLKEKFSAALPTFHEKTHHIL